MSINFKPFTDRSFAKQPPGAIGVTPEAIYVELQKKHQILSSSMTGNQPHMWVLLLKGDGHTGTVRWIGCGSVARRRRWMIGV